MSDKTEIYARLAEMITECTEKVKVCTPSSDFYRSRDEWSEDTMYVINAYQLAQLLANEADKE